MILKNIELNLLIIENGTLINKELSVIDVLKTSPYTKRTSDLIRFQSIRLCDHSIFNIMSEDLNKVEFTSTGKTIQSYLICYRKDIPSATVLLKEETLKFLQQQIDSINSFK
jgi:hypothetical protein